jgi:hypothetical protein
MAPGTACVGSSRSGAADLNQRPKVRVLVRPPRILVLTEISRFPATNPELAALFSEIWSLQQRPELTQPFRSLCLCPKNSVSRQRRLRFDETRFESVINRYEDHGARSSGSDCFGPGIWCDHPGQGAPGARQWAGRSVRELVLLAGRPCDLPGCAVSADP